MATATDGTYLTWMPTKSGSSAASFWMANVSVGIVSNGPRGSLSNLSASSPVLVIVTTTLRFWTPLTVSGPPGAGRGPRQQRLLQLRTLRVGLSCRMMRRRKTDTSRGEEVMGYNGQDVSGED